MTYVGVVSIYSHQLYLQRCSERIGSGSHDCYQVKQTDALVTVASDCDEYRWNTKDVGYHRGRAVLMSQFYSVVAALAVGVLLVLCVERQVRGDRCGRESECRYKPIFQLLRNGRVRFRLEDLRGPAPEDKPRARNVSDPGSTTPELPKVCERRERSDRPDGGAGRPGA